MINFGTLPQDLFRNQQISINKVPKSERTEFSIQNITNLFLYV
jgi:hypothetical protein